MKIERRVWSRVVIDSKERKILRAGESRLAQRAESITTEASGAALSEVLGQLSGEIEGFEIIEAKKGFRLIVRLAGKDCENDESHC
jgi:hypothetical protein